MGLYINDNGNLLPIAGRGKAEYGASTVRTGTASIPQSSAGATNVVSVTFDESMPDADYLVTFECSTSALDLRLVSYDKTATGFKIGYYASAATGSANTVKYTAFKLYTDNEYNGLLNNQRYSTDEINTGKTWIDGKPIYRKVLQFSDFSSPSASDSYCSKYNLSHNIGFNTLIRCEGMAEYKDSSSYTYYRPLATFLSYPDVGFDGSKQWATYIAIDSTMLYLTLGNNIKNAQQPKIIIIVEYTKTTD